MGEANLCAGIQDTPAWTDQAGALGERSAGRLFLHAHHSPHEVFFVRPQVDERLFASIAHLVLQIRHPTSHSPTSRTSTLPAHTKSLLCPIVHVPPAVRMS